MTHDNPHVPRPREGELLNGDLAVVGNRQLSNDGVTVPAESRPLYELLLDILWDEHVRDTMPARLAVACDDLGPLLYQLVKSVRTHPMAFEPLPTAREAGSDE